MITSVIKGTLLAAYRPMARLASGTCIEQSATLRYLHRRVISRLKPKSIVVDNHTFFLDPTDAMRLTFCREEPELLRFLKSVLKPGDTVIDAGAHIGYFTLAFARIVGDTGHVFAFEPTPETYALLRQNIEANGYTNVTAIQKAVSAENGRISLHVSDCSALNRIHASPLCSEKVTVDTIRLDDFFEDYHKPIRFVKLDIEGAEPLALRGMDRLLNQNKDLCIMTEFAPRWLQDAGFDAKAYLDMLQNTYGFSLHDMDQNGANLAPTQADAILAAYPVDRDKGTDIWCQRGIQRSQP